MSQLPLEISRTARKLSASRAMFDFRQYSNLQFEMEIQDPLLFISQIRFHKVFCVSTRKRGQLGIQFIFFALFVQNELQAHEQEKLFRNGELFEPAV
jgi:hypothetical protein